MRIRRFGWVRDLPDRRDFMYATPHVSSDSLPSRADLRAGFGPVYDQGELGSCTANALAGALQFLEQAEGASDPMMPSRLFIYYNERELEGTPESDSGAQIRDGIKSLVKQGFCSEEKWPYDIRAFAKRPPVGCYRAAVQERVSSYMRVPQATVPLLSCLAAGHPFVFGFTVYEGFETPAVARTGRAELPRFGEAVVGGHAVVACGYDLSTRRFTVRNSWGARWGLDGYFTMPFEYLLDPSLAADFWTLRQVPVPPLPSASPHAGVEPHTRVSGRARRSPRVRPGAG